MRRLVTSAAVAALLMAGSPAALAAPKAAKPAPLSRLVSQVDIPYEEFTLTNGLRVIVHTDRKTPTVAVSVWYGVGSSDEPKGKTGFAHLFEHLMFNGSANYDGEFFVPLEEVGATAFNGTTNVDRTNYFQTVPTPALDLALFLEADRMGNLLPAVTQEKLDNQRGVVQNEKRQGDNQPYGLFRYVLSGGLFPEGHPYHHTTIGSMADLDAASMADVQAWFKQYYGPNNAVLVLAGDIDAATARPLVEKHFGRIERGPDVAEPQGGVPERAGVTRQTLKDKVANTRIYMMWPVPGRTSKDLALLDVAATVLAGGDSSRFYQKLVRDEQLAVSVGGAAFEQQLAGVMFLTVDVKPGVDPAKVEARADELIAEFLAKGPTKDEVQRVATRNVAGTIRGLEQIGGFGGKAVALAEGELYANDPGFYKKQLGWYAAATPKSVQTSAKQWLGPRSHRLVIEPGERGEAELALAGVASQRPAPPPQGQKADPDRSKLPQVAGAPELSFPSIERATLANGVKVTFAQRSAVPVINVTAVFDAGSSADADSKLGLASVTLEMLRSGTTSRTGLQIAEETERLGAVLQTGSTADDTRIGISALKPNLAASLELLGDVIRNPAFSEQDLARVRGVQLSRIGQEETTPAGAAGRALRPLVYGAAHPYGAVSALGTRETVQSMNRGDLVAFHQSWLRPDNMQLFVVGDAQLQDILPALEAAFGAWEAPTVVKGVKTFAAPAPQGQGKVLLIDRPKSPQSVILAGMPIGVKGTDDPLALRIANETLGGSFTSRLNSDLRETKGWSYGVGSGVSAGREDLIFQLQAPVQADRTGDSIKALQDNIAAFLKDTPVTSAELSRAVKSNTLSLPGDFETANAVLAALIGNAVLGRPDDYQVTLAGRYRALSEAGVMDAARAALDPAKLTWVVVGDAAVVEPQLKALGIPFVMQGSAAAAGN